MQLSRDETLALVTFASYLVRADGKITDTELLCMMDLAREVGIGAFSEALDRLGTLPPFDLLLLHDLASRIESVTLRRQMYTRLVQLAESDGLQDVERALLDHFATWWHLDAAEVRPQLGDNVPHLMPAVVPVA